MKDNRRRPIRLLVLSLTGLLLIAVSLRYRSAVRPRGQVVPLIPRVRRQLALAPVLAAEEALRARPADPQLRLRLAEACARTGDPAGAALALYPLVASEDERRKTPELVTPFVVYGAQVGWLEQATAVLLGDGSGGLRRRESQPSLSGSHAARASTADSSSPPSRARAFLELAAACVAHGEPERAVSLLAALKRNRRIQLGMDEWLDGAMTWYQCRRPKQAGEWARRGLSEQPENPAARAVLARCLLAAGQPEAALSVLPIGDGATGGQGDEAKAPDHVASPRPPVAPSPRPLDPLIAFWRARAELRCRSAVLRRTGTAHLARIGLSDPPDPVAAFEAGRALLLSGQAARALPLLSRAARGRYQEVLTDGLLAQAYGVLGRVSAAAWARSRVQRARGQFVEAEASLRRSLQLDPSPAGAYLDLSAVLSLRGKFREALQVVRRAREQHPDNLDLALAEADALNQLDRFADQARVLEAAALQFPARGWEPLRNLGKMYYETRQFDQVIPVLERALPRGNDDAEVHRFLGLSDALHPENPDRAEKAVDHLLRAAALDPREEYQWTSAGAMLQRAAPVPYLSEAAACCRRAIDAVSGADGPYFSLAQIMQRQGRRVEAKLLLQLYRERRATQAQRRQWTNRITANRGDAAAHYALGDLLLRNGDYRAAFPYLLIAASLRPQWKQAQLRLADACALLDYVDLWQQAERTAELVSGN